MNKKFDMNKVESAVKLLLEGIGDDPTRDGLLETPSRVAQMYNKILNGYDEEDNILDIIKLFDEQTNNDIVVVKDISFYSFCEHHLQPFVGKLAIAYIPANNKVLGISKLVRLARVYAKRLQVQERLTREIMECIQQHVPNNGVAVKLECEHYCMSIRGVRTPGAKTVTMKTSGLFTTDMLKKEELSEALR